MNYQILWLSVVFLKFSGNTGVVQKMTGATEYGKESNFSSSWRTELTQPSNLAVTGSNNHPSYAVSNLDRFYRLV
jgi:hypothetical protein